MVLAALAVLALVVPSGSTPAVRGHVTGTHTVHARTAAYQHHVTLPNPLANLRWGTYSGDHDELFKAYRHASGTNKQLLGTLAFKPRMRWFGSWYSNRWISQAIHKYIDNITNGRSDVLVQMAIFRMVPWEMRACDRLPTQAEQKSYTTWINKVATAIGRTHVALVMQPDLLFAQCVPHHSLLPLRMVAYATRKFSQLPNTSVYIDAGASDWGTTRSTVYALRHAGIAYARGFALNATHYTSTAYNVTHGAALVQALAAAGFPGKRFVVNTAENGRPYSRTYYMHHRFMSAGGGNYNNGPVCTTRVQQRCVTTGITPTTDVGNSKWGLPARVRSLATKYCDAYMWIGRPWLYNQAAPFDLKRTLFLAKTRTFG